VGQRRNAPLSRCARILPPGSAGVPPASGECLRNSPGETRATRPARRPMPLAFRCRTEPKPFSRRRYENSPTFQRVSTLGFESKEGKVPKGTVETWVPGSETRTQPSSGTFRVPISIPTLKTLGCEVIPPGRRRKSWRGRASDRVLTILQRQPNLLAYNLF